MNAKYRSRKFLLAGASLFAGIIAMFTGHMTGSEFGFLSAVILGLYGGTNVWETKGKHDD